MKKLTKPQEVELTRELVDRIWELVERFEKRYKVETRVNFTVDRIRKVERSKKN